MIPYERDIYSSFVIKSEDLNIETFRNELLQFIKERKKAHDSLAIKINVDHQHALINPILKEIGFEFFYGDNDFTQWVYKNGSSIPQRAIISSIRAYVFLIQDGCILFTEQKSNTFLEGKIFLPGGNLDLNELPYEGGIREVQEEVGLIIKSMHLMGIVSSLHQEGLKTTNTSFLYKSTDFEGNVKMQEEEIRQWLWVPIKICAYEKEYAGLKICGSYNKMAQHILGESKKKIYAYDEMGLSFPGCLHLI